MTLTSSQAEARYGLAAAAFDEARNRARAAWHDLGQAQATGTVVVAYGHSLRPWKHGMPCLTCDKYATADGWFFTDAAFADGVNAQDWPICDICVQSRDPELHAAVLAINEFGGVAWGSSQEELDEMVRRDELMHAATSPFDRAAFLALPARIAGPAD